MTLQDRSRHIAAHATGTSQSEGTGKMAKKIALIDAHPDARPARFVHSLVEAYASGAREASHDLWTIALGEIDVPILRTREEWMDQPPPASVQPGQEAIRWADHVVFFYPLWHGDMPALLKAWLEQVMRPGFALDYGDGKFPRKLLAGRTARVVVTMGMPALFYRAYYGAHSVRSFKRNILIGCGIDPVESSLIGNVEGSDGHRARWLRRMHAHGVEGD
jgi:putative NADPH-quinone reductase